MNKVEKSRKDLGNKIKLARIQANLSQSQLAAKVERTGASIAYLEQGKRSVSTDILLKIAGATGKPITFFFQDDEPSEQNQDQLTKLSKKIEDIEGLLKKSENKYKNMIEQSPDFIFVARIDNHKFVDINQRACDYYGYSRNEFLDMGVADIQTEQEIIEKGMKLINNTPSGEVMELEGMHKRKDGTLFLAQIRFTKLNDELILGSVRNSSKLK